MSSIIKNTFYEEKVLQPHFLFFLYAKMAYIFMWLWLAVT